MPKKFEIIHKRVLNPEMSSISVYAPWIAAKAKRANSSFSVRTKKQNGFLSPFPAMTTDSLRSSSKKPVLARWNWIF